MREVAAMVGRRDWDGLQSRWVLPAARRLYLIGALLAVLIATLALVVAFLFQLGTLGGAPSETVPDVTGAVARDISVESLDSLFSGPQRLRADARPVARAVQAGDPVANLAADSVYGVAEFQLIGGDDADLVTEDVGTIDDGDAAAGRGVNGMVLRAGEALAKQMTDLGAAGRGAPTLRLRVVAKDRNGNSSAPTNVTVRLLFEDAEKDSAVAVAPASDTTEDVSGPAALRDVVQQLATIAAPQRGSPEWWDARSYAVAEPKRCDAENDTFYKQYSTAFRHVRSKLTASNLETFYRGLCDAWRTAAAEAAADAVAANARRGEILMRNAANSAATALRKAAAAHIRDAAIGVALSAVFFFMIIALFLAFMAIEGHSHAVQRALQVIADRDGRTGNG